MSFGGEHDSTGLRAQHKLNTPLSRCASPRNNAQLCAASETTPANGKTGSRDGSPFSLHGGYSYWFLCVAW